MVETLRSRYETDLTTSEAARDWTECSPNSKLVDIANKLAHYNWEDGDELRSLIEKREYKKFQSKIWINNPKDLDGKLWLSSFRFLCNYVKKQRRETHELAQEARRTNRLKTSITTWEDYNESDPGKISRDAARYLSNHETMSERQFNTMFSGSHSIEQGNGAGNCYFIAWIMQLADTQYFGPLMRTWISNVEFNDWSFWYSVKIPFWKPDGRSILIKNEELDSAKVTWNQWYKLLWIAYVKNRRPNNKIWNKYAPITKEEYTAAKWWWTKEVLDTFLWRDKIGFHTFWDPNRARPLSETLTESQKASLIWYLKNFNIYNWNQLVSLSSIWLKSDSHSYKVWSNLMFYRHAYALRSVDKDAYGNITNIKVTNTWNDRFSEIPWYADLNLTLPQFLKAFSFIWAWKLQNRFMNEKWIYQNTSLNKPWTSLG